MLILASNSPRRKELLAGLDINYEVRVIPGIDESFPEDLPANEVPQYVAHKKSLPYLEHLADNEVLLIIANFDEISAHVSVNIPAHAFEYLDIPPMACRQAIDLLTGEAEQLDFTPDKATHVYVDGFGGKILKFTF